MPFQVMRANLNLDYCSLALTAFVMYIYFSKEKCYSERTTTRSKEM